MVKDDDRNKMELEMEHNEGSSRATRQTVRHRSREGRGGQEVAKETRKSRSKSKDAKGGPTRRRRGSKDKEITKPCGKPEGNKVSIEKSNTKNDGLVRTATNIAMTLMGIPLDEQTKMTVKVKKERAEEDHRYKGEVGTEQPERTTATKPQSKESREVIEIEDEETRTKKNPIHQTTHTPKRKKATATEQHKQQKSSGKEKKKHKPVAVITPKRIMIERDEETEETQLNAIDQIVTTPPQVRRENKQPGIERANNTKTNDEESENKNQTDAKSNEEYDEDETPKKTNEATKKPALPNPYQRASEVPTTPTSNTGRDQKISYATATQNQTKIINQEKKRGKHNGRFEITFQVNDKEITNSSEKEMEHLRMILCQILKRAKKIDRKAMINTWKEGSTMRTVEHEKDLPFTTKDYKMYLNHPYEEKKIQHGKNTMWRVNISMSIPVHLFTHYWEQSKREYKDIPYVALKIAPMQTERYYTCGTFINSSDGQLKEQLIQGLSDEMKIKIDCSFRSAPLDKRSSEELWKKAYEKNRTGQGSVYRHAPLAMNVYTANADNARKVAKYLLENYGQQDSEGQYPRLPDGSRMRFIPASRYLDMTSAGTAKNLFQNQIKFNADHIKLNLPVTQVHKRFPQHDNKTFMELLLDMQCPEKENEPYFRHVVKKWSRDPTTVKYQVSIHTQMRDVSVKMIIDLHSEMQQKYDDEVAAVINTQEQEEEIRAETSIGATTLSLDTNDRYSNGSAKFIIEGMEALNTDDAAPTLNEQKQQENDNYTIGIDSDGTNNTRETFRTADGTATRYGTQTTYSNQGTSRESQTTTEWQRVGDKDAEMELLKKMSQKKKAPDPGGLDQGSHP